MAAAERSADEAGDHALVELALRGSDGRAAFGRLVFRRQGMVRAQLRRLTGGDAAWADELAQETFLRAWRNLGQFRREASFATWLFRIAYTTFVQSARRRKVEVEYDLAEEGGETDAPGDSALRLDLARALGSLNEAERMAIVLFYQLDMSLAEVAYAQGAPPETVKTRIARAKAKLREHLAAWKPGARGSAERFDDG
jgi:RNA polymerase sigma-70 factor (ECF subfamily)